MDDDGAVRRRGWAVAVGIGGVLLALVFVRLSLAWSDRQPYVREVTEPRYLVFIAIAGLIVLSGLAVAVRVWRGSGRDDRD